MIIPPLLHKIQFKTYLVPGTQNTHSVTRFKLTTVHLNPQWISITKNSKVKNTIDIAYTY